MQAFSRTEHGQEAFHSMREAAVAFDERLRQGIPAEDIATFRRILDQPHANVSRHS